MSDTDSAERLVTPARAGSAEGFQSALPRKLAGRRSYAKVAKEGVLWSVVRAGAVEFITTPAAMILARLLTPFDFGVAASVTVFTQFAQKITTFGFNQALVRLKCVTREHCALVFAVDLIGGAIAYLVLVGGADLIAAFYRAPQVAEVMPVVALTFVIGPFGTVSASLMSRDMEFKKTAFAAWVGSLSEALACIGLALAGFGYWSIVYGRVIGQIGVTTSKMILKPWRPSLRFSLPVVREMLSFGSGVFAKRLLDYGANNLDSLVVGRVLGVGPLGFYDKAFVAMQKLTVRLRMGGAVTYRIFALIYEEEERFRKAYAKVILAATLAIYPAFAGVAAAGHELFGVMFGPRWAMAVVPFQILCAVGALKILNEFMGSAAQAVGRIWGQVWIQAAYALLIVVFVAGLSRFGLDGAALGVLAATVVMTLFMNGLIIRTTGITLRAALAPQVPGAVLAAGVAATVLGARAALVTLAGVRSVWLLLPLEGTAAALFYMAYLKVAPFGPVRELVRETAQDMPPSLQRVARLLA
jgi:PST family polysaccharide transporter